LDCYNADRYRSKFTVKEICGGSIALISVFQIAIVLLALLLPNLLVYLGATVYSVVIVLACVLLLVQDRSNRVNRAEEIRRRIQEGSRYKEYEIEVVAALICPICNGDVDPSEVSDSGIYHCQSCGVDVRLPDWVQSLVLR